MIEHKHIIIRAEIKDPPAKDEMEFMRNWFKDLIKAIDMKLLKAPYLHYLDKKDNRGFTGVAIIETSHVAMHIWDEDSPALMQLDVYTCGELDIKKVLSSMEDFSPVSYEYIFLDRKNRLEIHDTVVLKTEE